MYACPVCLSQHNAALVSMSDGEKLEAESDPKGGIYVVISGLVKVRTTHKQLLKSNYALD